jgi:hypothetical protein
MNSTWNRAEAGPGPEGAGQTLLLWCLSFLICWGLGYPTLNRYDPRKVPGTIDAADYANLVVSPPGGSADRPAAEMLKFRPRVLVPYVAKPIYRLAQGRTGSWDPVLFGLLVANSLFCATTSVLLARVAARAVGNQAVALLGTALYLLNFALPNLYLCGYVDSGEACLLMAVAWAMSINRWAFLPILGVLGALAKETFVPLAGVFSLVWWLTAPRERGWRSGLAWVVVMDAVGLATVIGLWSAWWGQVVWPWDIAQSHYKADATFLSGLRGCLLSHEVLLVFGWLLPLGIWRLRRLPAAWVSASLATALFALLLSAWDNGAGNAARPMFNAAGPVLSLSVALLLARGAVASRPS